MNIQTRYLQAPTAMSGSTDTPILPEKFHDAIVFGALYLFGHAYIDDTRISSAKARFDNMVEEMKMNCDPVPDQMIVLQPWDTRPRRLVGRLTWPTNFPEYWR